MFIYIKYKNHRVTIGSFLLSLKSRFFFLFDPRIGFDNPGTFHEVILFDTFLLSFSIINFISNIFSFYFSLFFSISHLRRVQTIVFRRVQSYFRGFFQIFILFYYLCYSFSALFFNDLDFYPLCIIFLL